MKGLKGSVFPVLRLNFNRKHIPAHPVGLREGMQIRNWMRANFPEFRKLSQNRIEKYSEELVEKAIIDRVKPCKFLKNIQELRKTR